MGARIEALAEECMVEAALEVIGGKWKLVILRHLLQSTMRFGELDRALPGITPRMLTRQLRELEADGLVRRTVHHQVPPKVEYSVTEMGTSLRDITEQLERWGHDYRKWKIGRDDTDG
ncbi:DNA-binding HxlR family transcriptional regulator [Saccharomonospora amisosensis]|uniref:DNA-binding HxlR family transcriptional regulator n=1 Tax=Saccharomonospora amisosensis TaxID=1128677 RepID=A0A7X5UTE6_9PSEU|nr:DNA-binding HxlR family transcriptional regulator [Saccharomonospora amisosensis]